MSSREIAELCDKEHRNVLRDIENLNLGYGKLSLPNFGECDKEHRNVCRDIDNLNETYEKMGLLKIEQGYYTTHKMGKP